ncbi:MAG: thioether cross-link-forming SCIFF peptide maturase [Ruminococcus albus]|uniref:thioether cross-link-forming SCIFF peptide maturase n=1 Tax=Ruminococcus sp. TaxID=41978 RepID=UPI0025F852C0|nr:thioether cross-link-forming SCIFF peptide maturase [Ruminococcus sp.]MBE6872885.1 thioether cross-link-forming SCIFF peptide maturase [Ruminococcus albus]MBR0530900.1 thioether cross-link-forming SCIFF peptide maturase [Ruminococcus sp.]
MIHKFKLAGYNILLDVNSGGVHIVDDLTYDLLDRVEPPFAESCPKDVMERLSRTYPAEEVEECYEEIVSLYNDKILFSEDDYEKFALASVASPIKAMCLHVSHDCNLRCKYCFASTGDFGEGRKLMDFETAKRAIDFLIEKSYGRKFLEVDFFGGEPSMNFDVVMKTVEYARSREKECDKVFRFTTTTNGMHLTDDMIDFINREMYNVVLSIDGRKEVNDRVRVRVDGTGCYDLITKNFKRLVDKRGNDKDWYVRGTYTKYNLDFSEDVMHLYDLGFEQISVEPVMADPKEPYAITEADLPRIFKEYEVLAEKIAGIRKSGKFINFFHFMLDLDQGPCAIKRLRGCGCGNEYVAVTPDGDIYPCHQFVGVEEYKMGNLYDGSFNMEMKNDFARAHVYTKPECKKCWAKFYCSGGCNANNYIYQHDIRAAHKLSCQIQKKRLEVAIMMKAVQLLGEAE